MSNSSDASMQSISSPTLTTAQAKRLRQNSTTKLPHITVSSISDSYPIDNNESNGNSAINGTTSGHNNKQGNQNESNSVEIDIQKQNAEQAKHPNHELSAARNKENACNQPNESHNPAEQLNFDAFYNGATPISDFYRGASLLVTGGTGFVGKVLIQKLLRAFKLRKVYMLIRCKDNMTVEQRLEKFFMESIFDAIREEQPELFDKVHPIRVDYGANDLGIEQADREIICNEVEIVFNVVASVKFNEKLSDAIDINVLGTKKILDLSMDIKHLKSFVHISTLYCNCNRQFIKERVYENEIGYEKIMQIFRIFDDETLEKFRHCLIGDMPNTYTMTKKCAENLVNHRGFYMPAGIFRPPIVMSTYKDPFPGWTDNLYGPSGLCTWSARGMVRCIYGRASCKANMVPADYCVNAMIASAWDIARRHALRQQESETKSELPVYNYIFDRNNLTWGQYMRLSREGFHEPFDKALWCFSYIIIPSKPLHSAVAFFLHHIPAYILDLMAMVTGKKRIYIKAYRKITKIIYMMSWFGLKEWKFAHDNIDVLDELVNETSDGQLLQFNIATINWREYFRSYLSGIRRYFFKDNENKLEKRRANYRRLLFVHNLLKSTFGLTLIMCLVRLYFKIFKFIPRIEI